MTEILNLEIDGNPPSIEALRHRALVNYGHFTAMQVRDRSVRGLDLHLTRLWDATRELFDADLDGERVRTLIRGALGGHDSASVRVDVHQPRAGDAASVMVTVRPPAEPTERPVSLQAVRYQRPAAHLKHVGTFGLIHYGEAAERAGFDDALLISGDDVVLEGAIANIGFHDGTSIVWPSGAILHGIAWQLLDRSLREREVPITQRTVRLDDLPAFRAAFITNSIGISAVERVDTTALPTDDDAVAALRDAYEAVPWDAI